MAAVQITKEDSLAANRAKRGFAHTAASNGFVVYKYDAPSFHYDFRLELNGVLVRSAVTRGPIVNRDHKRLAVPSKHHRLDYARCDGTIQKGEYGGETFMLLHKYIATLAKAKPPERIFVDHLCQVRGATTLMRYGARSRPSEPIAVPPSREELRDLDSPSRWHIIDAAEMVKRTGSKALAQRGHAHQSLPDL